MRPTAAAAHWPYDDHRTLAEVWNIGDAKDEIDGRNSDRMMQWGSSKLLTAIRAAQA